MKFEWLFALTSLALTARAQILSPATTTEGSVLYFAAALTQRSSGQAPHSKAFSWSLANGTQLVYQPSRTVEQVNLPFQFRQLPPHSVEGVSAARDGSRLALTLQGTLCSSIYFCSDLYSSQVIERGSSITNLFGLGQISANGRFVVSIPFPRGEASASFIDLTGETAPYVGRASRFLEINKSQALTDDGTVVYSDSGFPILQRNGERGTAIGTALLGLLLITNRTGTTLIAQAEEGVMRGLYILEPVTAKRSLIFAIPNDSLGMQPVLQDDGKRVLIGVRESPDLPRQWLVLVNTDGSGSQWLGYLPEGYREFTLSGDGRVAYGVTTSNRIIRIETETDQLREIIPASPWMSRLIGPSRPGSENRILGGLLASCTFTPSQFPAPTELGGVRVEYAGRLMPLLKVSPEEIVYQIPWDMSAKPDSPLVRVLVENPDSPFEGPATMHDFWINPLFEEPGARHKDGTPVRFDSPVKPGEEFDAFAIGFQVPGLRTGVPAAEDPPNLGGLACQIDQLAGVPAQPLDVRYFGQAPGRAGVFKISFKLPSVLGGTTLPIRCTHASGEVGIAVAAMPAPRGGN
ncbi:MAG: hypothetical protein U0Q16_04030 [Bryobacteraceae bacterium]